MTEGAAGRWGGGRAAAGEAAATPTVGGSRGCYRRYRHMQISCAHHPHAVEAAPGCCSQLVEAASKGKEAGTAARPFITDLPRWAVSYSSTRSARCCGRSCRWVAALLASRRPRPPQHARCTMLGSSESAAGRAGLPMLPLAAPPWRRREAGPLRSRCRLGEESRQVFDLPADGCTSKNVESGVGGSSPRDVHPLQYFYPAARCCHLPPAAAPAAACTKQLWARPAMHHNHALRW